MYLVEGLGECIDCYKIGHSIGCDPIDILPAAAMR